MGRPLLSALGLVNVTAVQRDALGETVDGMLVYNVDIDAVQVLVNGAWKTLAPEVEAIFDALALEVGRQRHALAFLGLDASAFDPIPVPV